MAAVLAACGGSSTPRPTPTPSPTANPNAPVITSFTSDKTTVSAGETVTLTWAVQRATSLRITAAPGGQVAQSSEANGTATSMAITADTTFTLSATNDSGTTTRTVQVSVATGPRPRITAFTADPTTIAEGGATTLRWTTQDATRLELIGPGDVSLVRTSTTNVASGEYRYSPARGGSYRLRAYDAANTMAEATVAVTVETPASVLEFRVRPTSVPSFPAMVTVNWRVVDAARVELFANDVAVPNAPTTDSATTTVNVTQTTRIELRVTGGDGSVGSVSELVSQATAEVEPNDEPAQATPITSGASGALGAEDEDLYRIDVPAGSTLYAQTSDGNGSCAVDTLLELLDANGETLAEDDDGGAPIPGGRAGCSALDARFTTGLVDLAAGTYYLRVSGFQGGMGNYVLGVQLTAARCGDGFVQRSRNEQCDDENGAAGDGCDASCRFELGGTVTDGMTQDFSGTTTAMRQILTYGVTLTNPGYIAVETGAPMVGACTNALISTGILGPDGAFVDVAQASVSAPCAAIRPTAPALPAGAYVVVVAPEDPTAVGVRIRALGLGCGNGIAEQGETCDDGNTTANDGCSAMCTLESRGTVSGPPADQTFNTPLAAGQTLAYQVTLTQPAAIVAEAWAGMAPTECDTSSDMIIDLLDARGTRLGSDDDGGPGSCPALVWPRTSSTAVSVPAGTYTVVLRGFDAMDVAPNATLRIRVIQSRCGDGFVRTGEQCDDGNTAANDGCSATCRAEGLVSEVEPNNARAQATALTLARTGTVTASGAIGMVGDRDFFSFTVAAGTTITIRTHTTFNNTLACSGADTLVRLFDPAGMVVAENDDENGLCSELVSTGLAAGQYSVEVQHYDDSEAIASYFLSVSQR